MANMKIQNNGVKGQLASQSKLAKDFWVLTSLSDVDGIDLRVQEPINNAFRMRAARSQPLRTAAIQSKFFEGTNQVDIAKEYVLNEDGTPRKGFLAFLHTEDASRNDVNYLFSAKEIFSNWNLNEKGDAYYFSLKAGRNYGSFRNLSPDDIRDKVRLAISEGFEESVAWGWANAAALYASVRSPSTCNPRYQLLKIGSAALAIFHGGGNQLAHPVEPRKDVYPYFGTYDWGYGGEGPRLLAASVLAHFLCGRRPEPLEINRLVDFFLGEIKVDNFTFGKEEIFRALTGLTHLVNLEDESEALLRDPYEMTVASYAGYFTDPSCLIGPWARANRDLVKEESEVSGEAEQEAPR